MIKHKLNTLRLAAATTGREDDRHPDDCEADRAPPLYSITTNNNNKKTM